MTTATKQKSKPTPPSATFRKLSEQREKAHVAAREAKRLVDEYDAETEALRA